MAFDPIVEAVRVKLLERSQVGLDKYGIGLDRSDLTRLHWLRHAQEEAMDLANYLEVLIQEAETNLMNFIPKCFCGQDAELFSDKEGLFMKHQVCCTVCDFVGPKDSDKFHALQDWEEAIKQQHKLLRKL